MTTDNWNSGEAYERFMGRWSRMIAQQFVNWLEPQASLAWLDVGCGTGALTSTVLAMTNPASIVGIDPSAGFIEVARSGIDDRRATFEVADARSIPMADQTVDYAVSGLCLNFVPDPEKAVAEMTRVTRPGGTIAAYVWDYDGGMEMLDRFWNAALAVDPSANEAAEANRNPLCAPAPLRELFASAGLHAVRVEGLSIQTVYRDFDDYWNPFEGGTGPAPAFVSRLGPAQVDAIKSELLRTLPIQPDGSIHLTARAWAIQGHR